MKQINLSDLAQENNEDTSTISLISVVEQDSEVSQISPISSEWKKNSYKGITLASVLLNPLFAIFLYIAIEAAIDDGCEELGLENNFFGILFIAINLTVSFLSGLSDLIVVNPIEEAEEMLQASKINIPADRLMTTNQVQKISFRIFNYFNQTIGNSVFLVGAASAALSITYLTSSPILRWGAGIPITMLEFIYLNRLSTAKIQGHSYEFIYRIFNKSQSTISGVFKSPAKSLEVLIQVLINAINRGIVYGYIMQQIMKNYFNKENDSVAIAFISYMIIASFYTSLTSRTLNVHKQFFNPQFEELSADLLKNTKPSYIGIVIDGFMAFLRAGAASLLLYRRGPSNLPFNIVLTGSVGLFLIAHGFYIKYDNRLHQTVLDDKLRKKINNVQLDNQQLTTQLTSSNLFDLIKEPFKINEGIKISATIINSGSRLANWFSFLGFLITMNKLIKINGYNNFDFYDLLCIQQLLCNPSLENEISFFQETMVDILAYYRTKLYLEKKLPYLGWSSFWKAKNDYPKEYLTKLLSLTTKPENFYERELEQISPLILEP